MLLITFMRFSDEMEADTVREQKEVLITTCSSCLMMGLDGLRATNDCSVFMAKAPFLHRLTHWCKVVCGIPCCWAYPTTDISPNPDNRMASLPCLILKSLVYLLFIYSSYVYKKDMVIQFLLKYELDLRLQNLHGTSGDNDPRYVFHIWMI